MRVNMQVKVGFDRAKVAVATLLLIVYGLGMDIFISAVPGLEVVEPKYIWVLVFGVTFPILVTTSKIKEKIRSPLLIWLIIYNCLSITGLAYSNDNETAYKAFINLCATNLILLPAWLAVDYGARLPFWLCFTVFMLAAGSVIIDFFIPFQTFGIMTQGIVNRASGFYLNPNQAGFALCFLELLLILRSPPRLILPIILLGLLATLLTFSRAAFLLQSLLLVGLLWAGALPKEIRISAFISLFMFPFVGLAASTLSSYLELSDTNVLNRLAFMTGQDDLGTVAADDRFYIMISAIQSYFDRPFIGGGSGYYLYWDQVGVGIGSTHNMTLRYMLDFGIIGLFLWAALCLVIYVESRQSGSSRLALVISGLAFLASFFSHNLAEQGAFLVPLYFASKAGSKIQKIPAS